MLNPENIKVSTIEEKNNKAVFCIEPLPTGFGHTLGNALRRALQTAIVGAAATQVKINGATHQFSTIPGIKEDLVEITLNLKQLRFRSHSDNPVVVTIKKKGPGAVTGADIQTTSDIEVLNKDCHIATLSDSKTEFSAEIIVEKGTGYSPMEDRQTTKIGVIVLDALFSPVLQTNYSVEPARFGDKTDLDKVLLEVETDGALSPKEAVMEAARIINSYYSSIMNWQVAEKATTETVTDNNDKSATTSDMEEDILVEELPLQTRTINALKKQGIFTLGALAAKNDEELADIKNLGEKSLNEIKKLLKKEGLRE